MSKVSSTITLDDVDRIERRGVGTIFRGVISIADLYQLLKRGTIRYAPKYQRGFKSSEDLPVSEYDRLFLINDAKLQIDPIRARVMAVKFLSGILYTSHVTWNVRDEGDGDVYDEEQRKATLEGDITIPDTGHRHLAYYTLALWKDHPEEIPEVVNVDGTAVTEDKIIEMLEGFDPETESVFVEAYMLPKQLEGHLYDEFNSDAKPPSNAVAIDLNPDKTPSRRFVYRLMDKSKILAMAEVETRRNTIGNVSRKLVTTPTMEAAMRPYTSQLADLEASAADGRYHDLIDFFCAFFEEWAHHFPAWQPKAKAEDRHKLRGESFALSNIMIHPLFRFAFELWSDYDIRKVDWKTDVAWKAAVSKMASGKVKDATGAEYKVMDRTNPEWQSVVMVKTLASDGVTFNWSLSHTRQTRDAAYSYLAEKAGLTGLTKATKKPAAAAKTVAD